MCDDQFHDFKSSLMLEYSSVVIANENDYLWRQEKTKRLILSQLNFLIVVINKYTKMSNFQSTQKLLLKDMISFVLGLITKRINHLMPGFAQQLKFIVSDIIRI